MKRLVLVFLTVLALTATGAVLAQSPQNTTAPGPTMQREPGQTNNNLPNPGNPVQVGPGATTTESTAPATGLDPTGGNNLQNETETGTGVDVDVDTGDRAAGAVDVDVNRTTDADTDASGVDETGSLDNDADNAALPDTASNELLVAVIGLIALAAAFSVRSIAKQNV
ncbi:MAG TPA: hypothetical protein VMW27_01365 [Thermoanaerobaculia bacterium]|nr:hypothetical protein [Thermoanaerobaculia bacterium]